MKGFTAPLWPIRYKSLPDELLTSWLVRLAHGHGLRVQTFCTIVFGSRHQVWNRDVDRLAPEWILKEVCARTGCPPEAAFDTTLRKYENWLYPSAKTSGSLQWIQTLKIFHRKRQGFGLQFCAQCLQSRPGPYFRKAWRVAFNTICVEHQCMLRDRCPKCGSGVVFHRRDMGHTAGRRDTSINGSITSCYACGFDLCRSDAQPISSYDKQASQWHWDLCRELVNLKVVPPRFGLEQFNVMRQLSMLLTSRSAKVKLHAHVCDQIGIAEVPITKGKIPIETRPLHERHHLIQLVAWLMSDLEARLRAAWRAKAVRYNYLLKDFDDAPGWYVNVVSGFSDWRKC